MFFKTKERKKRNEDIEKLTEDFYPLQQNEIGSGNNLVTTHVHMYFNYLEKNEINN